MYDMIVNVLETQFPWLHGLLAPFYWDIVNGGWVFIAGVSGIFILEKLFPAKPGQPFFSTGLFMDMLWWIAYTLVLFGFVGSVKFFFKDGGREFFEPIQPSFVLEMPTWAQIAFTVLVVDFLGWFHHLVRHKVPFFWLFHAVHHSQREMNFFTCVRVHPFDRIFSRLIGLIPYAILLPAGVAGPTALAWIFATTWHERLYHANVRLDYGPLKYILVTPQSHRIHHSVQPEHRDTNFGVIFSVWDRIFRTQFDGDKNDYPVTGVEDPGFPHETSRNPIHIAWTFILQLWYPFGASIEMLNRNVRRLLPGSTSVR